MKLSTELARLPLLAVVSLVVGTARGDTIDILPPIVGVLPFGEQDIGNGTTVEYYAQEFILPVSGFARELSFFLQPRSGPDDTDFHLLLTETTGTGADLRPTNVLFESSILSLSSDAPGAFSQFTVDLGDTLLSDNTIYLWMLDSFVTADGIEGTSIAGITLAPIGTSGFHFLGVSVFEFPPTPGDRAIHFDGPGWNDPSGHNFNLSYSLNYEPVPEPSSILLLGTALAGLGFLRRWKKLVS